MKTTKTDIRRTLTRKGFSGWLDGQAGNRIVGIAMHNNACPIQSYLASELEAVEIIVGKEHCWPDHDGNFEYYIALPMWAKCFVHNIDDDARVFEYSKVTAKRARDILEEC